MKILILLAVLSFSILSLESEANDSLRTIHVFVALCDNHNQGIVPVPKLIGNGQEPSNNLYWGAAYGVKNYFDKRSEDWVLLKSIKNPMSNILERIVFKHTSNNTYLVADAYDGKEIKSTVVDFLKALSGENEQTISIDEQILNIGAGAQLVAYIGHNGLMDFSIQSQFQNNRNSTCDAIILACYSQSYFEPYLKQFGINPLVWSKGLMSPEAYTLKWAIDGWINKENNEQIVMRARQAYNHYQKCGMRGATNLLATGFSN